MINGKHWQGTHFTKIGADKSYENSTPNYPQNLSAQIVCLSPKLWDFDKKGLIGHTNGGQKAIKTA